MDLGLDMDTNIRNAKSVYDDAYTYQAAPKQHLKLNSRKN